MDISTFLQARKESRGSSIYLETKNSEQFFSVVGASIPISIDYGEQNIYCMIQVPEETTNDFIALTIYAKEKKGYYHWYSFLVKIERRENKPYIHLQDNDERWCPLDGVLVQIVDHKNFDIRIGDEQFTTDPDGTMKGKRVISDVGKLCRLLADCESADDLRKELDKIADKAETEISFHERIVELEKELQEKVAELEKKIAASEDQLIEAETRLSSVTFECKEIHRLEDLLFEEINKIEEANNGKWRGRKKEIQNCLSAITEYVKNVYKDRDFSTRWKR